MRRRYTIARNPIESLRERWGLSDGERDGETLEPTGRGRLVRALPGAVQPTGPAPSMHPLPLLRDRPLYNPPRPSDAGSIDYEARQRTQLDDLPPGAPADPVVVYPAWESRMVGMRDFLVTIALEQLEGHTATPAQFGLSAWTVPRGYTAFLKEFRFWMEPAAGYLTDGNTRLTLLLDGQAVPHHVLMPLGPSMGSFQKTFIIAEENRALGLQVDVTTAGMVDGSTRMYCLLYGNLRRRTGAAPANEVGTPPPPPPEPPPPEPEPPPQAPPFQIFAQPMQMLSSAGRGRGGLAYRLMVRFRHPTGRTVERLPSADELVQYKQWFDRVRAQYPGAQWV